MRDKLAVVVAGDALVLSYAVEIAADTCTRAGAQPPYRRDGVPA
jgi:fructokinase